MGKNNENPSSASANGKIIKNGASHSEPLESSITNAEAPNNDKPTEEKPKKLSNLSKGDREEIKDNIMDYYKEMGEISDFPEDFSGDKFKVKNITVLSTRANRKKRNEFNNQKEKLRKEWSEKHHQEWPTYTEDFYAKSGKHITFFFIFLSFFSYIRIFLSSFYNYICILNKHIRCYFSKCITYFFTIYQ